MAATYEYEACLVPLTVAGLTRVNRQGSKGWRLVSVHPLSANLGQAIDHDGMILLVFERVLDRDFEHLITALEAMFERITLATSQN